METLKRLAQCPTPFLTVAVAAVALAAPATAQTPKTRLGPAATLAPPRPVPATAPDVSPAPGLRWRASSAELPATPPPLSAGPPGPMVWVIKPLTPGASAGRDGSVPTPYAPNTRGRTQAIVQTQATSAPSSEGVQRTFPPGTAVPAPMPTPVPQAAGTPSGESVLPAVPPATPTGWRWHGWGAVNPAQVARVTGNSPPPAPPVEVYTPPPPPPPVSAAATSPTGPVRSSPVVVPLPPPPPPIPRPSGPSLTPIPSGPSLPPTGAPVPSADPTPPPPVPFARRTTTLPPTGATGDTIPGVRWHGYGAALAAQVPLPTTGSPVPGAAPPAVAQARPVPSRQPVAQARYAVAGTPAPLIRTSAAGVDELASLRERIQSVCEGKARTLLVTQPAANRLAVKFRVANSHDAEPLVNQLAALPELAPFKIDFEVQVGP